MISPFVILEVLDPAALRGIFWLEKKQATNDYNCLAAKPFTRKILSA
jgi:hypothetical protein